MDCKQTRPKQLLPVPNYYWKVVLKVKRSGEMITAASAIGFWLEHRVYSATKGEVFGNYSVSVDQLESYTGLDFFVNLPEEMQATAEDNSDWGRFCNLL